jgi:DNA-binding transcriptional regulator YdaS (Cro superfamily)
MSTNSPPPSPAELRARVAFVGIRMYKLGSRVDIHPSRLSQYLHGHVPLPDEIATRIQRALDEAAAE